MYTFKSGTTTLNFLLKLFSDNFTNESETHLINDNVGFYHPEKITLLAINILKMITYLILNCYFA